MSTDISHLVVLDPAFSAHGIHIAAFRLTVDEPDSDGDRMWRFAGRVRWEPESPTFGIAILLLDDVGLPLATGTLGFRKTITAFESILEERDYRLKELPHEVQLVLETT